MISGGLNLPGVGGKWVIMVQGNTLVQGWKIKYFIPMKLVPSLLFLASFISVKIFTSIEPSSFKADLDTLYKDHQIWLDIYTKEYRKLRDMQNW